jgi:hypothetical protein
MRTDGTTLFDEEVTPDEIVALDLTPAGDRVAFVDLNGGFGVYDLTSGALVRDGRNERPSA